MKKILLAIFSIAFVNQANFENVKNLNSSQLAAFNPAVAGQIEANMNDYMDIVMQEVGPWIVSVGLDPFDIPDIEESFKHKILLVTYSGELLLKNGIASNLREISRSGDSTMIYGFQLLRIRTGVAMKSIEFRFDYKAKVMNVGPSGWLDGSAKNLEIHCDFIVDITDYYLYIQDFHVTNIGNINVKIHGNIIFDWLGNIVIDIVTSAFKSKIISYVSDKVKDIVQQTIDDINNRDSIHVRKAMVTELMERIKMSNYVM